MAEQGGGKKRGHGGGHGGGHKKHKGGWGSSHQKDPHQKAIPPEMWGMLLTFQGDRGPRAVDEARLLFEEAYARMGKTHILDAARGGGKKPPAAAAAAAADATADAGGGGGDAAAANGSGGGDANGGGGGKSIEAMLAAEVAELKDTKRTLFRWHDTGVNNSTFVAFPQGEGAPSPAEVAVEVVSHIKATKQLPARFLLKLLPVESTCFISLEDIKGLSEKMMAKHFPADASEPVTFAVDMSRRACNALETTEVINTVAKAVPAPHKVNLDKPDRTVIVQLIRNVCAIGVAPRYKELFKYNVRLAAEEEEAAGGEPAAAAAAGEKQAAGGEQQQDQGDAEKGADEAAAAAVPAEAEAVAA